MFKILKIKIILTNLTVYPAKTPNSQSLQFQGVLVLFRPSKGCAYKRHSNI